MISRFLNGMDYLFSLFVCFCRFPFWFFVLVFHFSFLLMKSNWSNYSDSSLVLDVNDEYIIESQNILVY